MSSALLAVTGLICFFLGYRYYSKKIAYKIYDLGDDIVTPAHELEDGIDFVPTKKHILFGHHYTSIAGAAPIIGPCVAAFWGWLPAFLWIVLGTIFIGAVHDFGALVVSVREKGKSIADVTSKIINSRTRLMFLIFILLLIWLVLAVFAMAIADLFISIPSSVLPINIEIIVAIAIGWLLYKKKTPALIPSLIALGILYLFVWIGTYFPLSFEQMGITGETSRIIWVMLLFGYSMIASLLPVWFLLQPRDYINSHQLFIGLGLLFLGIFVLRPEIDAPVVRLTVGEGAPPMFPLLFVTIACGAISGFHGLVASGTTSKQVDRLSHTRFIGYGAMLGEGTLALASTLAAVAGIALVTTCNLPSVGFVENLSWSNYYDSWAHASGNKAAAFVLGGGALIEGLGISQAMAKTLMAVLVISFAATTLDTATRVQRFVVSEIGLAVNIKWLTNRFIATVIAILPAIFLVLWNFPDPSSGTVKQAGWILWPIFGASNQMLAALTFMVLTLYFWKRNKPVCRLGIPMIFIMIVTLVSFIIKSNDFLGNNNVLFVINLVLIILIVWMMTEGVLAFQRIRSSYVPEKHEK